MRQQVVYIFRWDSNDYFYIGQTIDYNQRYATHKYRSLDSKRKLYHVWRKYGEPTNVELIPCNSVEELNIKEQDLLDIHFDDVNCLNLSKDVGCPRGFKHSDEFKKQKSERMKQTWAEGKLGSFNSTQLIVIEGEYGTLFSSINEASELLGLNKPSVYDVLKERKRMKRHKGYEFLEL